jgi:hypothetical protein
VGNYGVYPNDGFRYWYDFFERVPPPPAGVEMKALGRAMFRPWFKDEFALSGYTYAMPVVFPRYGTFDWYDDADPDARWFRGLLTNADNAAANTAAKTPIIAWLRYALTDAPKNADGHVKPMTEPAYQELVWHLLLRRYNGFVLFCDDGDVTREVKLVQEVYAAAQEFGEFLDKGEPVVLTAPEASVPVVSALRLGDRVLVRRTDLTDGNAPVVLKAGDRTFNVPREPGKTQVLPLR